MKTQELKSYIDRVLGNSIRCLLPSYWWKRAFGAVIDNTISRDEVKTINGESIVGEGNLKVGVTTVGSIDELNALEAEVGDIATATREAEKFVGVGTLLQYEDGVDYNSLFKVKKVSISVPKTSIGELSLVHLSTREGNITLTIVCSADGKDGYIQAWYEDGRKVDLMREQTLVQSNIDDLNSYLSKNVVRYISAGASSGSHFEFIDTWFKVATPYTVADAYIKSDSWEKLSKEYVVSSEEELNALSVENGTIAKVAKWQYGEVDPYQCYSITNESSHDDDTIKRIWDKLTRISHIDITYPETPPTVMPAWPTILLHGYASTSDDVIQITYYQESYKIAVGNSGSTNIVSIDKMNTILQEKDYRLINLTNDKYARPFIEEHITFYSPNANITADAYIKGETWTRLLKEGDVVGGGPEILELTLGETEEDRANNVKIYNKIVEVFNSDDIYMPMISVEGLLVSNVTLSVSEGETTANLNIIADYISFKAIVSLSLTKTGEVEVEEYLEYSSYCYITDAPSMVDFAKCAAAGLLPNVLYTDPRQGLVIADTLNSEGDNIVLYFNLSKGRTKVVVSSETGEILSEEVVSSGADSTFVIDLTVDEIEEAILNNGGVIGYTLNRELIIDALSKNIPMVVRIGEHSNGYCLAQGELDGADTLTITFNYSQYKYSILIGDESIEVDRSSSISALEARLAALEAKLS